MRSFIIALILIMAQSASAGTLNDIQEIKSLSNKIMQHFIKAEFVEGLDIAKSYWPLPPVEIDGLANQINTQDLTDNYGVILLSAAKDRWASN